MIIIGIVGWKNSGKTRLMQGLIKYFSKKNFKVATIKHAHHNFDIDKEGTDSFLHRKSGAQEVLISSSKRWAKIDERNELKEMKLSSLIKKIERADIVFVEGFKNENHNKIEVLRKSNLNKKSLNKSLKNVIGIVSDEKIKTKLPIFKSKDFKKIYDFILLNVN
tara:strand:- start:99 stop:590 length:492 start_codon:yes stop_codon:yes gene_type:complete